MTVLELISFSMLLFIGVYAAISDIKFRVIKNRVLFSVFLFSIALDFVYYSFFARDIVYDFLINILFVAALGVALYAFKIWAAGDIKLLIVLSCLYPARFYFLNKSLILTVYFSFVLGYVFLLSTGIYRIVSGDVKISKNCLLSDVKRSFYSYVCSIIHMIPINLVYMNFVIVKGSNTSPLISIIAVTALIWAISLIKILKNRYIVLALLIFDIIVCIWQRTLLLSANMYIYIISAALTLVQIILKYSNYEVILAKDVKSGMILSIASSVFLCNSEIGFDKISKENQGSRLSDEDALKITRWGIGTDIELTIVRKIPFAVFIFLGFLIYFFFEVLFICKLK